MILNVSRASNRQVSRLTTTRPHRQRPLPHAWQSCHSDVLQIVVDHTVVHLVRQYQHVLLHAHLRHLRQLLPREHFADGVVGRVDDDHLGLVGESGAELVNVNLPLLTRLDAGASWRVKRDEDSFGALESDRGVVLVKVGFDKDDFVAFVQKRRHGGVHS